MSNDIKSIKKTIVGEVNVHKPKQSYTGSYHIIPGMNQQELQTKDKNLKENIIIEKVPDIASNLQDKTVSSSAHKQVVKCDDPYDGLNEVTIEPMERGELRDPYIVVVGDEKVVTTIVEKNGYVDEQSNVSLRLSTPSFVSRVQLNENGVANILLEATTSGFVTVREKVDAIELNTMFGKTVMPTTTEQTIVEPNTFVTGAIKVAAMPNGALAEPKVNTNTGLITASVGTPGHLSAGTQKTYQLPTVNGTTITPTKSQQLAVGVGRFTTGTVYVGPIPSNYIIPSGSETKRANGTYDVTKLSQIIVNVPVTVEKNIQCYQGYDTVSSTSYAITEVSITVNKSAKYNISWCGCRNSTSGTFGSALFRGDTQIAAASTSFVNSYFQFVEIKDFTLAAGYTYVVRARSGSTSNKMMVGNLIIEEA